MVLYNFRIAISAIFGNKTRAVLTSLGIICGVASVIAMLAIGTGAEQEILEKMKLLGTNNIIIKGIIEDKKSIIVSEDDDDAKEDTKRFSPGLTKKDALNIEAVIKGIDFVVPETLIEVRALRDGFNRNVNLVGIDENFFDVNRFSIESGKMFNYRHFTLSEQVCIIGNGIKSKMFPDADPVGKSIKCGNLWLNVVGVLDNREISKENIQNLGIRNYNYDIYIPISTMLLRYTNRSLVTKSDLKTNDWETVTEEPNPHQIDRIVVAVKNTDKIQEIAEIIHRMLIRRHNLVEDFEIIVPELLLEQERNTKRIFNIVLGVIASISLFVGGIGIMNIMLASVLERTKEIGIRRAVGAKQKDIMLQFLIEAVTISLTGGIIGIILGVSGSIIIEFATDITTIITPFSVFISFFVSISVGLIFGITPARKASLQDPIDLLRYE